MTIHEAGLQLRFQLFHIYDDREAGNITDLVMEHITGWKKIDRVVNKTVPLSARQKIALEEFTKALLNNAPVQYVLHEAWFYGMKLYVDKNVLIPRPETEELVDWTKKVLGSEFIVHSSQSGATKVLDVGTGSGCIPLAIKKSLSALEVHACDVSEAALDVAKKNAANLQVPVHFHLLDFLSEDLRNHLPVFDVIISNPPYIPQKEKAGMAANVLQFEPHLALFVADDDALVFYAAIADFAKTHLTENGLIFLEIHEDMAQPVIDLYKQKGFATIEVRKDMQGKDRMVRISLEP